MKIFDFEYFLYTRALARTYKFFGVGWAQKFYFLFLLHSQLYKFHDYQSLTKLVIFWNLFFSSKFFAKFFSDIYYLFL